MFDQPDNHGRLACTTERNIAHHNQRDWRLPAAGGVIQIALPFGYSKPLVDRREGSEQDQPAMLLIPGPQHQLLKVGPLHGAGCSISLVVRRNRVKPCWPAASMAVMTA